MFSWSMALHYLTPRKKNLSVTLIAFASVFVISLVVWLLIVFLSVTEGMEKNWIKKLTDLNAPVKITPTPAYFSSYYYRIDSWSSSSHFQTKTLGEKQEAKYSDPYNQEEDGELPLSFPSPHLDISGNLIDPVKRLTSVLNDLKAKRPDILFQDYEMSGATLKLHLLRKPLHREGEGSLRFLTQVAYLATPPIHQQILSPLLLPPTAQDVNNLLLLSDYQLQENLSDQGPTILPATPGSLSHLLSHLSLQKAELSTISACLLEEGALFSGYVCSIPTESHPLFTLFTSTHSSSIPKGSKRATCLRKGDSLLLQTEGQQHLLSASTLLSLSSSTEVHITLPSILTNLKLKELQFFIDGKIQGKRSKECFPGIR